MKNNKFINNKFKNNLLSIPTYLCKFYLKKNGKQIFLPQPYYNYLCILNNSLNFYLSDFKHLLLYSKNEDEIINKLLILYKIQKENFKYIKLPLPLNKIFIIFNDDNQENMLNHFFFSNINKKLNNFYLKTLINRLSASYMLDIFMYNNNNKKTLIRIFFRYYIHDPYIIQDMHKKYNKKIDDFPNYNSLYIFLKKNGYVDKYYNIYAPKMIKNYNKFFNLLLAQPNIDNFKKEVINDDIKKFSDINLLKVVDKHVSNIYNKTYIKNKFTEIIKKYNI
jgi:hypothetical protein